MALDTSASTQQVLSQHDAAPRPSSWTARLGRDWDVLGPFPIRAREQHLLSPAFPLQGSEISPVFQRNDTKTWSTALTDGGLVHWSDVVQDDNGHLSVSFPAVRWEAIRATEGWAALQHHALLHTTLTVTPPASSDSQDATVQPHLLVNAIQASFFAFLPRDRDASYVPQWHAGNIYAYPRAPKQAIPLPALSLTEETTFDVLLSADYEIRLFGDPQSRGSELPIIEIDFSVELEQEDSVSRERQLDVVPDFVDGFAFGDVLGLGLRNADSATTWEVLSIRVADAEVASAALSLVQERPVRIAPLQSRVLAVKIEQGILLAVDELAIEVELRNVNDVAGTAKPSTLRTTLSLRHFDSVSLLQKELPALSATHMLGGSPVQMLVIPPTHESNALPIVYLHGAGVEIDMPDLPTSIPRQPHSWITYPSGRTSWGFDWHGPSARHALSAAPALARILASHPTFSSRPSFAEDGRFVLVGHSNGGQGAWFVAARNPDRVAAVMPAAAYMKSQAYIAWSLERGAHYVDPILGAVLKASMTGDDNDLLVGNLVGKKVLALHGGADENVPTWHTRELVSVLRNWASTNSSDTDTGSVDFVEMPGKPHWYPDYFARIPEALDFLETAVRLSPDVSSAPVGPGSKWTMTVAWPHESGSMYGFRVLELEVPGRLARLTVEWTNSYTVKIKTSNVRSFSFPLGQLLAAGTIEESQVVVDGVPVPLRAASGSLPVILSKTGTRSWEIHPASRSPTRPVGPVSHALDTASTITIVVPNDAHDSQCRSAALRLSNALLTYLALDVQIVSAADATARVENGTTIVLSAGEDEFNDYIPHSLGDGATPFSIEPGKITLSGYTIDDPSTGALFAHPHTGRPGSRTVYVVGTDASGFERALRLFPWRTGIPVPEWIVIGQDADSMAAGGVLGAGFWDRSGSMDQQYLAWTAW
ncbi:hypothetical protein EXIGLDRAFT_737520 [Exidia glandulosa HHB12029]|uniref:Peptidase S9 prolyl oligopeptidase catalytic domain-containing protein n=1 Tax=Exidia glandulosa HHB12029 TaxID=1314781 RepID=A0A166AQ39_EXIGL|nr:hypothetical protein EXIGLDRAFT_737520 [Exidia glandulosa HHB12029]